MRWLKLTLSYDGTRYHGWQRQTNAFSLQQALEEKLARIFGEKLSITASGRTDAGVHALGQVVSFSTAGRIPLANIPAASRSVLPPDIVVLAAEEAPEGFNARFDAKGKSYIYRIVENGQPDPFRINYAWLLGEKLDMAAMQQAADMIVGEHDFTSFRASGSSPSLPVRNMTKALWRRDKDEAVFEITGNGFLYHMVRNLVGSMVEVGRGEKSPKDFSDILRAKDRRLAGKTAPAEGLYLQEVFY